MKRPIGTRDSCNVCGQDIEWTGYKSGWRDRGGNRACVPYLRHGEIITPRTHHKPRREPILAAQSMLCRAYQARLRDEINRSRHEGVKP